MDWYKDSINLLDDAEEILLDIMNIEKISVKNSELLKKAKPKIKHFLDDCRSPLDFIATFLRDNYTEHSRNVYYPIARTKDEFDKRVYRYYKNKLPAEVKEVMLNSLPIKTDNNSLIILNDVINENKHIRLSKSDSVVKHTVHHLELPNGITFTNCTFIGNRTPFNVDGKDYDLITDSPDKNADVSSRLIIELRDYNLRVVETFQLILKTVRELVDSLHLILATER